MAFKKGDKIVCVDDKPMKGRLLSGIQKGAIYTIEQIDLCPCGLEKLVLVGVASNGRQVCRCDRFNSVTSYLASRFSPILYRSVGISKELAKSFTETLETSEVITEKEKAI